ncbi:GGDEF domain-containing protein [Brevibacillus sp. TJ4]|uniref:GGDEF domain-containing protein n=1 Tax=Brevibacillus sp. TJ4 TaxID=3234853 RepID=UPI0037CF5856
MNISEIMAPEIPTITSDKSVAHAADRMYRESRRCFFVADYGEILGILTSRDVFAAHPNRIVADAMTQEILTISINQDIWAALELMEATGLEQGLVVDEDQLAGYVTRERILIKLAEYMDSLTGLYKAPYIQSVGEKYLNDKQPFHLLFIDLNDFGTINKLHGHPFGDDVIRAYASILASLVVEKRDFLSRYAGDEFVLISRADEEVIERYIEAITQPSQIGNIWVTAAVGHVNGFREPDFFRYPFRELVERASLQSSAVKSQNVVS